MLATNIYDLATKFFPLVASCLLSKKVNFEPWDVIVDNEPNDNPDEWWRLYVFKRSVY